MMRIIAGLMAAVLWCSAAFATDCSGTITTGGTAQTISGVNSNTRVLSIMNNSANLMCISWNGSAAAIAGTNCASGSWTLQPGSATAAGGSFYSDFNGVKLSSLSIISASAGDRFSCERQ